MKTLSRDERIISLLIKENPLLARVLQRVGTEHKDHLKSSSSFPRKNRKLGK